MLTLAMNGRAFNWSDLCFKLPTTVLVCVQSGSGKSTFLLKLLQNREAMFEPPPKSILYAYSEAHPHLAILEKMGVQTFYGVPQDEDFATLEKPALVIFDDLLNSVSEKYISDLFIRKSHHRNLGVIFLTQSIFEKNLKVARNNSHYIVLMSSPSMAMGIRNLATQLFPTNVKNFMTAYGMATAKSFGYLLIDLSPTSDPLLRLRSNIFPKEAHVVFIF
jgi:hypothetical protein